MSNRPADLPEDWVWIQDDDAPPEPPRSPHRGNHLTVVDGVVLCQSCDTLPEPSPGADRGPDDLIDLVDLVDELPPGTVLLFPDDAAGDSGAGRSPDARLELAFSRRARSVYKMGGSFPWQGVLPVKRLTPLVSSALALLLAGATSQAAPIFSYTWSPDAEKHFADGFGPGDTDHYVDFSNEASLGGPFDPVTHKTTIVATNLRVFSSPDDNRPDTINSKYTLRMVLENLATGHTHTFTFGGTLSGSFSTGTSNLTNSFTLPSRGDWFDVNGDWFKVWMSSYTPPGPPDASLLGSIGATVTFTSERGYGFGPTSPEPSTLLLSFIGLPGLGVMSWRKWRGYRAA
jgi:hypothetical protein